MKRLEITAVSLHDLRSIKQLLESVENRAFAGQKPRLKPMAQDSCLLLSASSPASEKSLEGAIGLDLDSASIKLLLLKNSRVLPAMLRDIERIAVSFGLLNLNLTVTRSTARKLDLPGYVAGEPTGELITLKRSLSRRQTRAARLARQLNRDLGVPPDYGCTHRLKLQAEPSQLASIGPDVFQREQFMLPAAAKAFLSLQRNASAEGIDIQAVSAFRSMDYQAGLLRGKLEKGLDMDEILRVSAAPGYSEHHSGRAIDITAPGEDPLEESFANTVAFEWLSRNAGKHGFRMSYPENNRHGVAYEPWHWYFSGAK
jgi:D-alanyl-D-alanine carboxypeptidase